MNKSYSKTRHIQITNLMLEQRRFKELMKSSLGNVNPLIVENFSEQMTYGDLKFYDSPKENSRFYAKELPGRLVYAFIKKDGENYYGKTGYSINFEGTLEDYTVTDDYNGPSKTADGFVKMPSYDSPDFYREFVERAFKLSDIKLQYLSKKL